MLKVMLMDELLLSLNVNIDYFVERKSTPSWFIQRSKIDFHDITCILSGSAVYIVNDKTYLLNGGDIVYLPKSSFREAYTSSEHPMHCYAFNFQCNASGMDISRLPMPHIIKSGLNDDILRLYRHFNKIWLERSQGYALESRAIFMLILNKYLQLASHTPAAVIEEKRITAIKDYIIHHCHEKFTLKELADKINLNPVYMGAYFKKKTGLSIQEYSNRIRVQRAEDLIAGEGCTVGEAACRTGFEDIYYFSKVYKKIKGYPPSHTTKMHNV